MINTNLLNWRERIAMKVCSNADKETHAPLVSQHHRLVLLLLVTISVLAFAMVCFRIRQSNNWDYLFMMWNLFLAWLSVCFAYNAMQHSSSVLRLLWLMPWLLFFPNAPYLVTDLVHLPHRLNSWYWYDQSMLVIFAFNGIMLGSWSLLLVHRLVATKLKRRYAWSIIFVLLFLCAYGVYLGRIERYNSWDIIFAPLQVLGCIWNDFRHPLQNQKVFMFTFVTAAMLTVVYLFVVALRYPQFILKKNINE